MLKEWIKSPIFTNGFRLIDLLCPSDLAHCVVFGLWSIGQSKKRPKNQVQTDAKYGNMEQTDAKYSVSSAVGVLKE
jgi:hypothetical protein